MIYDNSHNDLKEFIHWDFSSKFATPQQQIVYKDKEKDVLYERHKKETIDVWEGIA